MGYSRQILQKYPLPDWGLAESSLLLASRLARLVPSVQNNPDLFSSMVLYPKFSIVFYLFSILSLPIRSQT